MATPSIGSVQNIAVGTTAIVASVADWLPLELFNVRASVVVMAGLGVLLSYADENEPRTKRFYIMLVSYVFTSVAAVSLIPAAFGWRWYDVRLQGSLAFIFGMVAKTAIPLLLKMFPEMLRKWTRIGEYKQNEDRGYGKNNPTYRDRGTDDEDYR